VSNSNIEEPTDDEWRSDLVRDFKKVGKSPISTPVDSETSWVGYRSPDVLVAESEPLRNLACVISVVDRNIQRLQPERQWTDWRR